MKSFDKAEEKNLAKYKKIGSEMEKRTGRAAGVPHKLLWPFEIDFPRRSSQ